MLQTKSPNPPDEEEIDISDAGVFDFIQATRRDYIQQRDRSLAEENETERSACGQLMLVTTVLLSATVLVVGNSDILKTITDAQKILVVIGFSSLILSIFSGIKYYFELVQFNFDWAKSLNDVVTLHSEVDFKTFKEAGEKTDSLLKKLPTQTPKKWLKRQIGLLASGVIMYLILLIAILFNFQAITNHVWTWLR
jgi:ABC-type multidrug transport system fused ATPase/permease subunit